MSRFFLTGLLYSLVAMHMMLMLPRFPFAGTWMRDLCVYFVSCLDDLRANPPEVRRALRMSSVCSVT